MAKEKMNWPANMLKTIARVMATLSPNCRQASRLQSEALDHKLPIFKRTGLWIHLLLCKWCRRYGKQIRFLRDAAHEHPDELVEGARQKLSDASRERIKQRLSSEEK
jgi:hypothetical protein